MYKVWYWLSLTFCLLVYINFMNIFWFSAITATYSFLGINTLSPGPILFLSSFMTLFWLGMGWLACEAEIFEPYD